MRIHEINYKKSLVLDFNAAADIGEGPGGSGPPLFLDQTEARRAEKFIFLRPGPFLLSDGLDPPLHCMVKSGTVVEIDELDESFQRSKNLRPKKFVTNFCTFLSRTMINKTHP